MPLRKIDTASGFIYRCSGSAKNPPAVFLPGVHGCWTPVDRAKPLLSAKLNFVEVTYPYFDQWTLVEYAEHLREILDENGIESAHLIGESFGSLVAWQFALLNPKRVRSHILLGGLIRAPGFHKANSARWALHYLPSYIFDKVVDLYIVFRALCGEPRRNPGIDVRPYPAVRTFRGQRATANRMRLIHEADFSSMLSQMSFPIRYLGGERDWVVPVCREIETLRASLADGGDFASEIIKRAPHAFIASHYAAASEIVLNWIDEIEDS